MTKGQINRTGVVHIGDARFSVWEEGILDARTAGGYAGAQRWERQFKREVFLRIVQQLNRLGWTCHVPADIAKQYSLSFARSYRVCRKGDLHAELHVSGRCIEFQMWQGVNTPSRPDHGGRYESNKEAIAPYLLRLEMQRTRRRIVRYLCNVFAGYSCAPPKARRPELAANSDQELSSWSRADADGNTLSHGAIRWWRDRKGRLVRGRVYGGINGMWALVCGSDGYRTTEPARRYFTYKPGMPRKAADPSVRTKRLKTELAKAIEAENFERAALLRDILKADQAGATPGVRSDG